MLSQKQQFVAVAALIVGGLIALTFARWLMDDLILAVVAAVSFAIGKYSR